MKWLLNTPYRALEQAYEASKKIQNIQRDYLVYKDLEFSTKPSSQNMLLYMDAVLEELTIKIYWNLFKFKFSKFFLKFVKRTKKKGSNTSFQTPHKFIKVFDPSLSWKKETKTVSNNILENTVLKKNELPLDLQSLLNSQCFSSQKTNQSFYVKQTERKLAWIEAALGDLDTWKNSYLYSHSDFYRTSKNINKNSLRKNSYLKVPGITYQSIGLVPRSITRTLSRFQNELVGHSSSLVLQEFRLAKYQAIASIQYMACLIVIPWGLSLSCKIFFLNSWVENWWNVGQYQVFLNLSQEDKALKRLQEVEELLWLDIIIGDSAEKPPQDLAAQVHQKTVELVEVYNKESIHTILDLFTDLVCFFTIIGLLFVGKKRLAILNSWIQELFYSLSDTMKAFFILLFTDLCIGFHSPHGWEILVGFLLEHFGFAHNKHVISCFVSTFPVILDTVFKYWIFRHLNRISPSIVVSYHTMNE